MKKTTLLRLLAIVTLIGYLMSVTWYSRPYKGQVVDESGRPVAGAVVGIGWVVTFDNPSPVIFKEDVTDDKGKFEISGWTKLIYWPGSRMVGSPYLYVVKRGYRPLRLSSGISYDTNATPRKFKTPISIKSVDLKGIEEECRELIFFASSLCGEMRLTFGNQILDDGAIRFWGEFQVLPNTLPEWGKHKYIRGMLCF
jgi:hypothetical protein